MISSAMSISSIRLASNQRGNEIEQDAAGQHRADLPGDVGADGVHQQVILIVLLQGHLLDDPGGHGEGGDARAPNHGVDLLPLGQEQVHDLGAQHPADGVHHKAQQAQAHDE